MNTPSQSTRFAIGVALLAVALLVIAFGCSLTWGATGACIGGGITLIAYAVGFFASADV